MFKKFIAITSLVFGCLVSANVSAHTGMAHDSLFHSMLHFFTAVSIFSVLVFMGFIAFKYLFNIKKQRIRK